MASHYNEFSPTKNKFNIVVRSGPHISDIKLIRTDTTLDLSQKAEKGMSCLVHMPLVLYPPQPAQTISLSSVVLINNLEAGANVKGALS